MVMQRITLGKLNKAGVLHQLYITYFNWELRKGEAVIHYIIRGDSPLPTVNKL